MNFEKQVQPRYDSSFNNYKFSYHTSKRRVNTLMCSRCNYFRHIAKYCHTMRFSSCDGFGHKAQCCLRRMKQPERNVSYNFDKEIWRKSKAILDNIKNDVCRSKNI